MLISELEAQLKDLREKYGDRKVFVYDKLGFSSPPFGVKLKEKDVHYDDGIHLWSDDVD